MQKIIRTNPIAYAFIAAMVAASLLLGMFFLAEPVVSYAITDSFTISQTISGELSFVTPANDVTMDATIAGITGGSSLGTSTVVVRTNNPTGYKLSINFASTTAMIHNTATSSISNYTPASAGTPDNWAIAANSAEFGYSVIAPSGADAATKFQDNGTTCNGACPLNTYDECWYQDADATTVVDLVNASAATAGVGATTSIRFQVEVGANPSPAVVTGTYTATATLTLVDNP